MNHRFYGDLSFTPVEFCGKNTMWQVTGKNGLGILPEEIEPAKGEHDFNTCEGCQHNLKITTQQLTEKFNGTKGKPGFPFCCKEHSQLAKINGFKREDYVNVPAMVARKIIYTTSHILNSHSSPDWYKKITDYIEYAVMSFGQFPIKYGGGLYLSVYYFKIVDFLKTCNPDSEKRDRILEFIKTLKNPPDEQTTDLNILVQTYSKWFKIFPFELNSYFGNLKKYYETHLPIISGKTDVNIYSGLAKAQLHTKSSLVEALVKLTNDILTKINGPTLLEKKLITDANKIKLDLVINSRRLKLKQGYINNSQNDETRYRKILKEWFEDEKKFIDEITPLLHVGPTEVNAESSNISDLDHTELLRILEQISRDATPDFNLLKNYIRDNYLNIHPSKFTVERLKQLKRNINTWSLQLQDLDRAREFQLYIKEVITDIDLKLEKYTREQYRQPDIKAGNQRLFTPQSFSEIFVNPEHVIGCLNLLRDAEKPCIDDNNKFIGSSKGTLIIWFNALVSKGMFKITFTNDNDRAATLNFNFPELNVSASIFRKNNDRAKENKNYFLAQIASIKIS